MRYGLRFAAVVLLGLEGAAGAGEKPLRDPLNARNTRFSGEIIPFGTGAPRVVAAANGNRCAWPAGTAVTWRTGSLSRDRGRGTPFVHETRWTIDDRVSAGDLVTAKLADGTELTYLKPGGVPWTASAGRHHVVIESAD